MAINTQIKDEDLRLWKQYKMTKSLFDRSAILKRLDPIIQSQVNKWAGPIPREVLENEAKLLAIKALDTYDENKGATLSTHIVNSLQPISRLVYSHQNATRLPENLTLKLNSYLKAKDFLTTVNGHSPTLDELHQELGWSKKELNRIDMYHRKDLVESVGGMDESFYSNADDAADDVLTTIYMELTPQERELAGYSTGYWGMPKLNNTDIMKRMHISQAQLSYQKSLLKKKIQDLVKRIDPSAR